MTPLLDLAAHPGLTLLAQKVRHELQLLAYPARSWVIPRHAADGTRIYDVLIVGAGQGGLACAFGLQRERVDNVLVVDDQPLDRAGPWLSFARMHTLRTPKHVSGPDLGAPSLTPRAFYEALNGEGSFERLGLIPKETWAQYLSFYRQVLELPVRPETRVGVLSWEADARAFAVPCTHAGRVETLRARRVVLATGIEGSGDWVVPPIIRDGLPRSAYAHTREPIDFAALSEKRVAVLGAGASAFDNASVALEHGAREVRMFFRRDRLVRVNPYRWAEFVGFLRHHADLDDRDKYRFIAQLLRMGQLPPADTYARAMQHAGFHIEPGTRWERVAQAGEGPIQLHTNRGLFETDFVIVATGFVTDLRLRPELSALEPHVARWADRYTPDPSEQSADLDRHPYLGPGFELCERVPGAAPYLAYLYNYTFGGLLSLGFGGASISGMKYSIPRLVSAITGSFFREDREAYYQSLCAFDEREF